MRFYAVGWGNFDYAEDAPAGSCEVMENLRNVGRSVRPVGNPALVGRVAEGEVLLAAHSTVDGVQIISGRGTEVIWHSTVEADGSLTPREVVVGFAPGEVLCAEALGRTVVVGCKGGDVAMLYEGSGYRFLDRREALPELRLTAADASVVTAQVEGVAWTEGYASWRNPLLPADVAKLTEAMLAAVGRLESAAVEGDCRIYPFLARYGVRLTDGSYLAVSAPVVIGSGLPLAGEYRTPAVADGSLYTGIEGFGINAPTFRLGVEVIGGFPEEWDSLVAAVDILVADEVTTVLRDRRVGYRCEKSGVNNQALLMLRLDTLGGDELVRQLLSAGQWRVGYTITDFAALRAGTAVLRPAKGRVEAGEVAAAERLVAVRRSTVAVMQHNRRIFSACGEAALVSPWGASAVLRVDSTVNTTYEAAVIARLSTSRGEAVTLWRGSGKGQPVALNPLLSYPDPRATSLEVQVQCGGVVRRCEVALSSFGSVAYANTPQLTEREFADTGASALTLPSAQPIADDHTGLVVESREMNALVERARHQVCDSPILALAPDLHHSNNAIGTPVYAFATSGVYALPYRVAAGCYSPGVIISRRRIAAGTRPAGTARRLTFVTTQGELCEINQYKVAAVARHLGDVRAVGYVEPADEVWMLRGDGTVAVADSRWLTHTRTGGYAAMMPLPGAGVYLATAAGELRDAAVEVPQLARVRLLTAPFSPTPGVLFTPVEVTVDIAADLMQGSIVVRGERGHSCHGMVLCRLRVDGEVARPIGLRLLSPPLRTMRVEIEGKVSADAEIAQVLVRSY